MISAQARDSLDRIFRQAALTRLPVRDGDPCNIAPLDPRDASALPGDDVVVLTISSMTFRLLLALHFADDDATRDYYLADTAGRTLRDTLMEVANLCCGAMNQLLVECFPDLGMSTPYLLNRRSVRHLDELRPGYVSAYGLTVGSSVRLGATLCVCSHAPLDFVANLSDVRQDVGELELF
ncbi:hypothetical protein [Burkholderia alba]|uniref:hypothetical protein n=1 Tax=Burkholderia alba TaxID=2683677 RepID=UPI002B054B23|nr:hypothetical protein [Burkholderia alba]